MTNFKEINFLQNSDMPIGYQVYEKRISIADLQIYRGQALSFCKGGKKRLQFIRDKENKLDKNAIAVTGFSKGFLSKEKEFFLGYIPRDIARKIVGAGLENEVIPRLERIYLGNKVFLDIAFQLIGKAENKDKYQNA
ncbi:MAG: HIRAN domain-containing protein [Deltaproteobacteria bacterium]|jgi:hypothetical protein|nr:HIRAN domain-containing protein [Deltaproteobacteria bacterium]